MTTNDETVKLNLDVTIYPEAPDSFYETEAGKLILSSTELRLPGDITFNLSTLKNATYEKIDCKHIIKLTTTSDNEIYISIPDANKLKHISYAEIISDSIQDFASTASTTDKPPVVANQPPSQPSPSQPSSEPPERSTDAPAETPEHANATPSDNQSQDNATCPAFPKRDEDSKDSSNTDDDGDDVDDGKKSKKETTDSPIYMYFMWGHYKTRYYYEIYCPETNRYYEHYETRYYDEDEIKDHLGEHSYQEERTNEFEYSVTRNGRVDIKFYFLHLGKNDKFIKFIKTTIEAYDRDFKTIGESTLVHTESLMPTRDFHGSCEGFFLGNEYLTMRGIRITKVDITYTDYTHVEITDRDTIRAMKSESAKTYKIAPPADPPCFIGIKWGHLDNNEYRGEVVNSGIINNNVDIEIFCVKVVKKPCKLEVTLQAYDSSGNPIGKPITKDRDYSSHFIFPGFFSGEIYSSIDNIKMVRLACFYEVDNGITRYFEITDESMLNAITLDDNGVKAANEAVEQVMKKRKEEEERKKQEEEERKKQEERNLLELKERAKKLKEEEKKQEIKNARAGCLSLIIIIVLIALLLHECGGC